MKKPCATPPGGIYVHVPFCRRKCVYCDFYSTTELDLKPAFLDALAREISAAARPPIACDTLYIGGGTPSLLEPHEVGAIAGAVISRFRCEPMLELTLEVNPGTVDFEKLKAFRSVGVDRLNIGVQSFREENLRFLGRAHSAGQCHEALAGARRAGFENIGLDLIYGLPGQSLRDWLADLESALARTPEHIACYMLTVEPGTPLAEAQRSGRFQAAPEAAAADLFLATSEFLSSRGYRHYEISNFARLAAGGGPALVSRHNFKYWSGAAYRGFGPAAHSFLPPRRFWNHRDVKRYVQDVCAGRLPLAGEETLTAAQQMTEAVMLGLRTAAGIDLQEFNNRFGVDFMQAHGAAAAELQSQGLLRLADGRCAPTLRGMLYINTVTSALV